MTRPCLLLAFLLATGCGHAAPDTREQLLALGRHRPCTDDLQCRTAPLGEKPCGGPDGYMAYSTATADPANVAALAERYRKERAAFNARSGLASDCRFHPDPGAVCRAGACQLGADADS